MSEPTSEAAVQADLFGEAVRPLAARAASGAAKPTWRLYVDEVGNAGFRRCETPANRYLSLTGVAVSLEHARDVVAPEMTRLKQKHFGAHPDDDTPLVLHRRELVRREGPFAVLNDPHLRAGFDGDLFACFTSWDYRVFTVVVDKFTLNERSKEAVHPYHAALAVIVQRYARWLRSIGARGDVMAEGQGGGNDLALKDAFCKLLAEGTPNVTRADLAVALTSGQLKVKLKGANVAGLQLADLMAHPACEHIKHLHGYTDEAPGFSGRVMRLLADHKFDRSLRGDLHDYGCSWMP